MESLFKFQGLAIYLQCENILFSMLEEYLESLCKGQTQLELNPLMLELKLVDSPPSFPADAKLEIKGPLVNIYSCKGKGIFFAAEEGSIIYLNIEERKATGFITKNILNILIELLSLVGGPLTEMLKAEGFYFLHAAALSINNTGFLFTGDGGCGKTTTALSLLSKGYKYVSDDSLVFRDIDGEIIVYPLYRTFNLDQDLCDRFHEILRDDDLIIPEGMKLSVEVSDIFPGSFIQNLKPDFIIFPKITSDKNSRLSTLSQMEIYKRLLSQIILAVDQDTAKLQLEVLGKLVRQISGFELLSGKDIYEEPGKVYTLISTTIH